MKCKLNMECVQTIFLIFMITRGYFESLTELQIRGGIEDNSKIIFLISQYKHML